MLDKLNKNVWCHCRKSIHHKDCKYQRLLDSWLYYCRHGIRSILVRNTTSRWIHNYRKTWMTKFHISSTRIKLQGRVLFINSPHRQSSSDISLLLMFGTVHNLLDSPHIFTDYYLHKCRPKRSKDKYCSHYSENYK